MKILKFKDYGFEFSFDGTPDEEKIACSLINDIVNRPSIVGVDFEDIRKILANKISRLIVYEFALPFVSTELEELIKGSNATLYGMYGNYEQLNMSTIQEIGKTISNLDILNTGAPFIDEQQVNIRAIFLRN